MASVLHESSQPPLCRGGPEARGEVTAEGPGRDEGRCCCPAPSSSRGLLGPLKGKQLASSWALLVLSPAKLESRGHPQEAGCPGDCSQPGLAAGWSSGSGVAIAPLDSAGRRGQGQGRGSPPATPGLYVDVGKKSLTLSTRAAGASSARADRSGEKPAAPTTHPPPAKLYLIIMTNDGRHPGPPRSAAER